MIIHLTSGIYLVLVFRDVPSQDLDLYWKITMVFSTAMILDANNNKANLRDLIAATGLVIFLKLDSNHRFFSHVTLKFDWWPWKIIRHLFYITSSFVHNLKPLGEFELQLLSGNDQFGSKSVIFFAPCELEIQRMTLKNNRDPLLCYIKLCASFQSHRWIQTKVTVRKRSIRAKMGDF